MAANPLDQVDSANPREDGLCIREAKGAHELEAVLRFRYEHFFNRFPTGYPGVDHEKRQVVELYDFEATHLCAFDGHETLMAVSTALPAGLDCLPDTWARWFGFDALGAERLERTVVSTRMVLHPRARRTDLFTRFHRAILYSYQKAGHLFAVHYSRPDLISRYESLGHRRYHKAFHLPSGQLRAPMIMDLSGREAPAGENALPPDFVHLAFGLMRPGERLEYLISRLDGACRAFERAHSEFLDRVLRQASLLGIDDAWSLWQSADEAFLGLILSGSFEEKAGPASRMIGPGNFIGSRLLVGPDMDCTGPPGPPGTSVTSGAGGAEMLVFAPNLVRAAALQPTTQDTRPAAIWNRLLLAVADAATQADTLPPMPTREGNAVCGTP